MAFGTVPAIELIGLYKVTGVVKVTGAVYSQPTILSSWPS